MSVQPFDHKIKELVQNILSRAADDIEFREKLLSSPAEALADSGLPAAEQELVGSLRRVAMEEWGVDVRRYRSFLRDNGMRPPIP